MCCSGWILKGAEAAGATLPGSLRLPLYLNLAPWSKTQTADPGLETGNDIKECASSL